MTREEILQAFDGLRVWQRGSRRAVHKPLLILYELGRLTRGESPEIEYNVIEPKLIALLDEFGPAGASKSRHYPFWHLRSDGFWELHGPSSMLNRAAGATPTITELRTHRVTEGFSPAVRAALSVDPSLVTEVSQRIVDAHFPESIQHDVLDAVGLGTEDTGVSIQPDKHRRDSTFRQKVLLAYEYRCCLCCHDIRLFNQVIGLEAAHIQWFQVGGPDIETNGLALCSLHHKIFDLGAFTVAPDTFEVQVSRHVMGSPAIQARLLSYHGAALIRPQRLDFLPKREFLEWDGDEVPVAFF